VALSLGLEDYGQRLGRALAELAEPDRLIEVSDVLARALGRCLESVATA
jgi:hypothetical protein